MAVNLTLERQAALVAALADPVCYPHPVGTVQHLETHISHILLAGDYAYKIKKPLNLGFLDFTSLARRHACCLEEVRLNQRLAAALYLDCIPICGSVENPRLGGETGEALEFAVQMRRFPQEALLDHGLEQGVLQPYHIDRLARQLAAFHTDSARAEPATAFGTPAQVHHPVAENFTQIRPLLHDPADLARLAAIEAWTVAHYAQLQPVLAARKAGGWIREGHGDLHLGNMILRDGDILIFDCIEFNEDFRWIDVMNDLAFLLMDLHRRGVPRFAWRLLNGYLEYSGDYGGLAVLPYYQAYRAMVRAKIAAIRQGQADLDAAARVAIQQECRAYLALAQAFTRPPQPFLLITHGVSGSGKSYLSSHLAETLGAIRLRSDVERKRLFGMSPLADSGSALNQGLYTAEAGRRTYEHLRTLADELLTAGYPVLVDATFLEVAQRQPFRALAQEHGVPFVLLVCGADPATLRDRVGRRKASGTDAAEADLGVLEQQLQRYAPPAAEEQPLLADADLATVRTAVLARVRGGG